MISVPAHGEPEYSDIILYHEKEKKKGKGVDF